MQQNRTWIKPWLNPRPPIYHVLACYVLVSLSGCLEGNAQSHRRLILDAFCAVEAGNVQNALDSSEGVTVSVIMIRGGVLIETTADSLSCNVFEIANASSYQSFLSTLKHR